MSIIKSLSNCNYFHFIRWLRPIVREVKQISNTDMDEWSLHGHEHTQIALPHVRRAFQSTRIMFISKTKHINMLLTHYILDIETDMTKLF